MTNPSASPGPAISGANSVADALQLVLATEHAAVYHYPMVGVRLPDSAQAQRARALEAAHRQLRDAVMAQLARLGVSRVAAQPAYPAPESSTGTGTGTGTPSSSPQSSGPSSSPQPSGSSATASAIRSAVAIEEQCASAYRYLLTAAVGAGDSGQPVRVQAMTGLVTAAADATWWRSLVAPRKPTVALPGL